SVDLRVEPTSRIEGRVLRPTGETAGGVRVVMDPWDPKKGLRWVESSVTWTAADGTFEFGGLPVGADCAFTADLPGFLPATARTQCAQGDASQVELRFETPQRLEVIVLAAETGAAVVGAGIELFDVHDDGWSSVGVEGRTGADGRCAILLASD